MKKNLDLTVARIKLGKSQRLLSWETNISQSILSNIETGFRLPRPEEAAKIARALNTSVRELFPEDSAVD